MRSENVELDERAFVEQHLDAVAGGRLAGGASLVGGLGLRMQRLVAAFAVLVDLLFRDSRGLSLWGFDSFQARRGSSDGRQGTRFPGGHSAYRRRRAAH